MVEFATVLLNVGLLMLVSGGNSVCFSLNMFLINSGQAWDAARKFVLFGMLKVFVLFFVEGFFLRLIKFEKETTYMYRTS